MAKTRKRVKPEDMTEEQKRRSQIQKDARAAKAARRHEHDGERHEHDFGDRQHTHGIDGIPAFTEAAEGVAVPVVASESPQATEHNHEGLGVHKHLEGSRLHYHNEKGAPVFVDKTPEEVEAEHASALEAARKASEEAQVAIPTIGVAPTEEADILLHVLVDGFTVLGKVWYKGEEIRLKRGTREFELTVDSTGRSWTDMSPEEQIDRYNGVQQFGVGLFPGRVDGQMTEEDYLAALSSNDQEALRRYEKAKQRSAGPPGRELVASGPGGR
jgi:hypothetical protein